MQVKDSFELHREIWDLALVEVQDLPWEKVQRNEELIEHLLYTVCLTHN